MLSSLCARLYPPLLKPDLSETSCRYTNEPWSSFECTAIILIGKVREVNGMGMEVCATLGMINAEQAKQLKEAGLTAYNHNLDTSREFYPSVITTRRVYSPVHGVLSMVVAEELPVAEVVPLWVRCSTV